MRIDSSGRLLLGTTTAATNAEVTIRAASPQLSLYATPGNVSRLTLGDTDDYDIGQIGYDNSDNSMFFSTNNATRMSIDLGLGGLVLDKQVHRVIYTLEIFLVVKILLCIVPIMAMPD